MFICRVACKSLGTHKKRLIQAYALTYSYVGGGGAAIVVNTDKYSVSKLNIIRGPSSGGLPQQESELNTVSHGPCAVRKPE